MERKEVDEAALRSWLQSQPRSTSDRRGRVEGDPLNLVVVGDRETVLQCFGARWDEALWLVLPMKTPCRKKRREPRTASREP